MKNLSDYTFYDSWQLRALDIKPGDEFLVLTDLDDLQKGQVVRFAGFDDVDNHYGEFVFTDSTDSVLVVRGDCSSADHSCMRNLKAALSKRWPDL